MDNQLKKNIVKSKKDIYKHLIRPDGKLLNNQDKLILDLFIQFTNNKPVATTTYKYLLAEQFPNTKSQKTINRTLKNISNYINAKFNKKVIIDGVTYRDRIVLSRVNNFGEKISKAFNNLEHSKDIKTWTLQKEELDILEKETWTDLEVDKSLKAEEQGDIKTWTPQKEELDKMSIEVDKNVQVHIEEGNILSLPKRDNIISLKEKSKKKKRVEPDKKSNVKISEKKTADGENTKNSESRFLEEATKSSYAFVSDEDLPLVIEASNAHVGTNAVVASSSVQASPVALVANSLAVGLAKESLSLEPLLATSYLVETSESISEEEHNRISGMIPLPDGSKEIYESVDESTTPEASVHELVSTDENETRSNALPIHENQKASGQMTKTNADVQNKLSPEILSNANPEHPKWQDLRTQVLKSFRSEMAWGIIHNLQIRSIKPNRLGLSFGRNLGMNEEQKEILRSCLHYVYGQTIEMVISRPDSDADAEVLNCKVFVADERKPMPKPLKKQFEMMEQDKAELDILAAIQEREVIKQVAEVNQAPSNRKKRSAMQISVEHGLALAETKWAQVRVAVENSFGEMLKKRFVEYFKKVEVVGMTNRLLKLKAYFWTAENMQTHQWIIEKIASRYDLDLEVENTSDGSREYYPWTYASHENEPFELSDI